MNTTAWIQDAISEKDFELEHFVRLAVRDSDIRDEIIHQMVTNPGIMVYYHCYEAASMASQQWPELFYPYWQDMVSLLKHENSYHRDFALTIIANLTQVDREDLFSEIFDAYFELFNDEKFMTAQCFVRNCRKILKQKRELRNKIAALLLDMENRCDYPLKQKELLKADILDALDEVFLEIPDRNEVYLFIQQAMDSLSPKTRKIARAIAQKYGV